MLTDNSSLGDDLDSLFREARDISGEVISMYLSTAGFGDMPSGGALALQAIGVAGEAAPRLARTLGLTEGEAGDLIGTLVRNGYLEPRDAPAGHHRPRLAITERGRAAAEAALTGFKAARWRDLELRQGDIVVSSWPKTGTTWVQMMCALLIFQTTDLPAPLSELSPWPDLSTVRRDAVYAQLAAQRHRRIIKTHLSLSDIPIDSRVTYIAVGRHPLDSALSLYHQNNNTVGPPEGAGQHLPGPARRPQQADWEQAVREREWLLNWIDLEPSRKHYHYLAEMLRHLSAAWSRRDQANVVLLHYEDLSADLAGEMHRLADRLGIDVPAQTWARLVAAASFDNMRADPEKFLTSGLVLKDKAAFFRRGVSGDGRANLTMPELARYHARVASLAPADLLAWLHRTDPNA
jgi:aryl sulfotransferase